MFAYASTPLNRREWKLRCVYHLGDKPWSGHLAQTNSTTFVIQTTGVYRIDYLLDTNAASTLGSVDLMANGANVGGSLATLNVADALLGTNTISLVTGDLIQLTVLAGPSLSLNTADITFTKVG